MPKKPTTKRVAKPKPATAPAKPAGPSPCAFCHQSPMMHRHGTPGQPGAWAQIECKSAQCADRIVTTQRFATEQQAMTAWENGRG